MALIIEPLVLSYPQFVLGEIINPDHANQNNYDIANKVNEFINEVIATRQMATSAQTDAEDAINIANTKGDAAALIANTKGDEAILIANTKGDSAIGIANATTSVANAAVVTANAADGKANTAVSTANAALGQGTVEPYTGALGAMKIATDVKADYEIQKPLIEQAVIDAEAAVDAVAGKADVTYVDQEVQAVVLGQIPDGTITDAKLGTDIKVGSLTTLTTTDKTSTVNAINEIDNSVKAHKADYTSLFTDNADAKNSIYRGKYLGNTVTTEQYDAISSGAFTDLYIGDYWTIGGINWRIAAFNYYRNTGDTLVPGNHITIAPDTQLYTHAMNDTNITTGGYIGSKMYIEGLEQAKTTIRGIFGTHLVKHRQIYSNATVDGKASGWAWVDSEVDLMSEIMVYGSVVWGESTIGGTGYNIGVGKSQLPLFALNPQSINTRQNYWLRDVVSAAFFANVNTYGYATTNYASLAIGVRPAFSIS